MKLNNFAGMVLAVLLTVPGTSFASNSVLSGVFDGSEMKTGPLPGSCGGERQLAYQDTGTFQVSADGIYLVFDAFNFNGADITALIYEGEFDPANPSEGLLTPDGIDTFNDNVTLVGGATYRLVVQQWCENREGAWALTFSGPGSVTSDNTRSVPAMTEGLFTANDPTALTDCNTSASQYHETGPFQVSATGTYYYTDVLIATDVDACLQVYTAPFNPSDPNADRVSSDTGFGYLDDFGSITLEAGRDYYFVVQPLGEATSGEYFYVLAPPAPFRINKALSGAWFNPQTNGQGMFLDVYETQNLMFVGWYTYDLSRPVDGTAELGEPGHRWLTALGPIDGASASLDVYLAQGGAFDAVDPPIGDQVVVGSLDLEFADCLTGTANYALTTPVVSGQIPLQPLTGDHVELCESMTRAPGMPGEL